MCTRASMLVQSGDHRDGMANLPPEENNQHEPEDWLPHPQFPSRPEFYRRVLEYAPTPTMVVDSTGQVLYGNSALRELGGWDIEDLDTNLAHHVHPADLDWVLEAFATIVADPTARVLGASHRWAAIYTRIITKDGTALPVEVSGIGGTMDPMVNGLIYEVRLVESLDLTGRVLEGLSQGAPMLHLLSLVTEFVASPPLNLDAAILQTDGDQFVVIASTSPHLAEALRHLTPSMPWPSTPLEPKAVDMTRLPGQMSAHLDKGGFVEMWTVDADSPLTPASLRLVAAAPTIHAPAHGPRNRLTRARQLSAAVLLRSQADVLLDYAAGSDELTNLPNRAAFYQKASAFSATDEQAALHVDLDGVRRVVQETSRETADIALQIVADRLRSATSPTDVIGRIEEDGFVVLFEKMDRSRPLDDQPSWTLDDRLTALADNLLEALTEPIFVGGRPLIVGASIGIALGGPGINVDQLLTWADAAMHEAKRSGGGRVRRYKVSYG